jgi:splicing factor 3B subunit 3
MSDPTSPLPPAYFRPRPLENLVLSEELESLDPIMDSKVMNILPNSDTPQVFAACGRGARSTFRTLRHGLDVEEVVSSDLPGIPNAVWTTKVKEDGEVFHTACSLSIIILTNLHLQISSIHISSYPL